MNLEMEVFAILDLGDTELILGVREDGDDIEFYVALPADEPYPVQKLIDELVEAAIPGERVVLPPPFDVLGDIDLAGSSLVLKKRVPSGAKAGTAAEWFRGVRYGKEVNLGPLTLREVGIFMATKSKKLQVELFGSFLGVDFSPLTWDPLNEPAPSTSPRPSKLRIEYMGLGQHMTLLPAGTMSTFRHVDTAIDALSAEDADIGFHRDSGWLIAAKMTIIDAIRLRLIFNDPFLYGAHFSLYGPAAKALAGLDFEILYAQIRPGLGVFRAEIVLPDRLRYIELGAASLTMPTIAVEIYTNGNFLVDIGFPHDGDFSRSFAIGIVILGVPVLGEGGFYFGVLDSETSDDVPAISNGRFDPVIVFGIGLSIGVGKKIQKGPLNAEVSLKVYGIVEGVFATFEPDDPNGPQGELYYKVSGTLGIRVRLWGEVDLVILAIEIEVLFEARATVTFEAYREALLKVSAEVTVRGSIRIAFVKITKTFKKKVEAEFTVGSNSQAPWRLGNRSSGTGAGGVIATLSRSLVAPPPELDWTRGWDALPSPTIEVHLRMQPTLLAGTPHYVAMLLLAAVDLQELIDLVREWLRAAMGNPTAKVRREWVQYIADDLADGRDSVIFTDQLLLQFIADKVSFQVVVPEQMTGGAERSSVPLSAGATVFPMLPGLVIGRKDDGVEVVDTAGDALVTDDWADDIRAYLRHHRAEGDLLIGPSESLPEDPGNASAPLDDPTEAPAKERSFRTVLLVDWFEAVVREVVDDMLDRFTEPDAGGATTLAALAETAGFTDTEGLVRVAVDNAAVPLAAGTVLRLADATEPLGAVADLNALAARIGSPVADVGTALADQAILLAGARVVLEDGTSWEVRSGETLSAIARDASPSTTPARLAYLNRNRPILDRFKKASFGFNHYIRREDSLASLAARWRLPVSKLAEAWADTPGLIQAGVRIEPALLVESSETLQQLADRAGITVAELAEAAADVDDLLVPHAGQPLGDTTLAIVEGSTLRSLAAQADTTVEVLAAAWATIGGLLAEGVRAPLGPPLVSVTSDSLRSLGARLAPPLSPVDLAALYADVPELLADLAEVRVPPLEWTTVAGETLRSVADNAGLTVAHVIEINEPGAITFDGEPILTQVDAVEISAFGWDRTSTGTAPTELVNSISGVVAGLMTNGIRLPVKGQPAGTSASELSLLPLYELTGQQWPADLSATDGTVVPAEALALRVAAGSGLTVTLPGGASTVDAHITDADSTLAEELRGLAVDDAITAAFPVPAYRQTGRLVSLGEAIAWTSPRKPLGADDTMIQAFPPAFRDRPARSVELRLVAHRVDSAGDTVEEDPPTDDWKWAAMIRLKVRREARVGDPDNFLDGVYRIIDADDADADRLRGLAETLGEASLHVELLHGDERGGLKSYTEQDWMTRFVTMGPSSIRLQVDNSDNRVRAEDRARLLDVLAGITDNRSEDAWSTPAWLVRHKLDDTGEALPSRLFEGSDTTDLVVLVTLGDDAVPGEWSPWADAILRRRSDGVVFSLAGPLLDRGAFLEACREEEDTAKALFEARVTLEAAAQAADAARAEAETAVAGADAADALRMAASADPLSTESVAKTAAVEAALADLAALDTSASADRSVKGHFEDAKALAAGARTPWSTSLDALLGESSPLTQAVTGITTAVAGLADVRTALSKVLDTAREARTEADAIKELRSTAADLRTHADDLEATALTAEDIAAMSTATDEQRDAALTARRVADEADVEATSAADAVTKAQGRLDDAIARLEAADDALDAAADAGAAAGAVSALAAAAAVAWQAEAVKGHWDEGPAATAYQLNATRPGIFDVPTSDQAEAQTGPAPIHLSASPYSDAPPYWVRPGDSLLDVQLALRLNGACMRVLLGRERPALTGDLWASDAWVVSNAVLPPGHVGLRVLREDLDADDSTGEPDQVLRNLYQLLATEVVGDTRFKAQPMSLAMTPDYGSDEDGLKPWGYLRVLNLVGKTTDATTLPSLPANPAVESAAEPAPTTDVHAGVGAAVEVALHLLDVFGNTVPATGSDAILPGGRLKLPVRYTDPIVGPSQWAGASLRFAAGAQGSQMLRLCADLDPFRYSGEDARQVLNRAHEDRRILATAWFQFGGVEPGATEDRIDCTLRVRDTVATPRPVSSTDSSPPDSALRWLRDLLGAAWDAALAASTFEIVTTGVLATPTSITSLATSWRVSPEAFARVNPEAQLEPDMPVDFPQYSTIVEGDGWADARHRIQGSRVAADAVLARIPLKAGQVFPAVFPVPDVSYTTQEGDTLEDVVAGLDTAADAMDDGRESHTPESLAGEKSVFVVGSRYLARLDDELTLVGDTLGGLAARIGLTVDELVSLPRLAAEGLATSGTARPPTFAAGQDLDVPAHIRVPDGAVASGTRLSAWADGDEERWGQLNLYVDDLLVPGTTFTVGGTDYSVHRQGSADPAIGRDNLGTLLAQVRLDHPETTVADLITALDRAEAGEDGATFIPLVDRPHELLLGGPTSIGSVDVTLELARRADEVEPELRGTAVEVVRLAIPPDLEGSATSKDDADKRALAFAKAYEDAFEGWMLAIGSDAGTAGSRLLTFPQTALPRTGLPATRPDADAPHVASEHNARFYAPQPVSTRLWSSRLGFADLAWERERLRLVLLAEADSERDNPDAQDALDAHLELDGRVERAVDNLDADLAAQGLLSLLDRVAEGDWATAVASLPDLLDTAGEARSGEHFLAKLTAARSLLATKLSQSLVPILLDQPSASEEVIAFFRSRLLGRLADAYLLEAIVEIPVELETTSLTDWTLSLMPKVQDAQAQPEGPILSNGVCHPSGRLVYSLDIADKRVGDEQFWSVVPPARPLSIRHDGTEYAVLMPEEGQTSAGVSTRTLGHHEIPIVLRRYPATPDMLDQIAVHEAAQALVEAPHLVDAMRSLEKLDSDAEEIVAEGQADWTRWTTLGDVPDISELRAWRYGFSFSAEAEAQDDLIIGIDLNTSGTGEASDPEDPLRIQLIDRLAEFALLEDELRKGLSKLPDVANLPAELGDADIALLAEVGAAVARTTSLSTAVAEGWASAKATASTGSPSVGAQRHRYRVEPDLLDAQELGTNWQPVVEVAKLEGSGLVPWVSVQRFGPPSYLDPSASEATSFRSAPAADVTTTTPNDRNRIAYVLGDGRSPEDDRERFHVELPGLDVAEQYNAIGFVSVERNRRLWGWEDPRRTNPAFVYDTPDVRFRSQTTPLFRYDIPEFFEGPREDATLAERISSMLRVLLDRDPWGPASDIRLGVRLAFPLNGPAFDPAVGELGDPDGTASHEVEQDTLFTALPVLLVPNTVISQADLAHDSACISAIAADLTRWLADTQPPAQPLLWEFEFTLHRTPPTVLSKALAATPTKLTARRGLAWPEGVSSGTPQYFQIDQEIIRVTKATDTVWSISRGAKKTEKAAHLAGAEIHAVPAADTTVKRSGFSATDTELEVDPGSARPADDVSDANKGFFLVDGEVIGVTAVDGNTWTITRGERDTTAAGHNKGRSIYALPHPDPSRGKDEDRRPLLVVRRVLMRADPALETRVVGTWTGHLNAQQGHDLSEARAELLRKVRAESVADRETRTAAALATIEELEAVRAARLEVTETEMTLTLDGTTTSPKPYALSERSAIGAMVDTPLGSRKLRFRLDAVMEWTADGEDTLLWEKVLPTP